MKKGGKAGEKKGRLSKTLEVASASTMLSPFPRPKSSRPPSSETTQPLGACSAASAGQAAVALQVEEDANDPSLGRLQWSSAIPYRFSSSACASSMSDVCFQNPIQNRGRVSLKPPLSRPCLRLAHDSDLVPATRSWPSLGANRGTSLAASSTNAR